MESEEDYEFPMETSVGRKTVIISKSALRVLGGARHDKPIAAVKLHEVELTRLVERKLARPDSAQDYIRLSGIDLNGIAPPAE